MLKKTTISSIFACLGENKIDITHLNSLLVNPDLDEDINQKDCDGYTILHLICDNYLLLTSCLPTLLLYQKKIDLNQTSSPTSTSLMHVILYSMATEAKVTNCSFTDIFTRNIPLLDLLFPEELRQNPQENPSQHPRYLNLNVRGSYLGSTECFPIDLALSYGGDQTVTKFFLDRGSNPCENESRNNAGNFSNFFGSNEASETSSELKNCGNHHCP
jgi:hypothetical protein